MPKLNKKKGKVLMVASAVGFREEEPFWLCKIIYLLRTEKIIPLWFSHSEVSQLYLKWEVIHLAVNGQELRLHSANHKTGKWWCASHPGASFAKHLTTGLPSEAANYECFGKKKTI